MLLSVLLNLTNVEANLILALYKMCLKQSCLANITACLMINDSPCALSWQLAPMIEDFFYRWEHPTCIL